MCVGGEVARLVRRGIENQAPLVSPKLARFCHEDDTHLGNRATGSSNIRQIELCDRGRVSHEKYLGYINLKTIVHWMFCFSSLLFTFIKMLLLQMGN